MIVFVLLLAAGGYGFHLWLQAQRLEPGTGDTPVRVRHTRAGRQENRARHRRSSPRPIPVQSATPRRQRLPRTTSDDRAFLSAVATPPLRRHRAEAPTVAPLPQTNELVIEP